MRRLDGTISAGRLGLILQLRAQASRYPRPAGATSTAPPCRHRLPAAPQRRNRTRTHRPPTLPRRAALTQRRTLSDCPTLPQRRRPNPTRLPPSHPRPSQPPTQHDDPLPPMASPHPRPTHPPLQRPSRPRPPPQIHRHKRHPLRPNRAVTVRERSRLLL